MSLLNDYSEETLLTKIRDDVEQPDEENKIVAAYLNGHLCDLQTEIGAPQVTWVRMNDDEGMRIYRRSVVFLLVIAVHKLYPDAEVFVRFSANKGLYCEISGLFCPLDQKMVNDIEDCMRELVKADLPITKKTLPKEEAIKLFKNSKQIPKVNLLTVVPFKELSVYFCDNVYDCLYGALLDKTGSLGKFELDLQGQGVLLRTVGKNGKITPKTAQPKLHHILAESKRWASILNCNYIPDLNRVIRHGKIGDLIRISEGLHEKRISDIADDIARNISKSRLILIAGPSSSGKTSFAQRLRVQLLVNGLVPISLSLDDYFFNRSSVPLTPEGRYDFESLHALDVELFNQNLVDLLQGKPIMRPRYDFITGERTLNAVGPIQISEKQPIIVEGIHALNEELTSSIPREKKYKIYVSALAYLNIDGHNRIPTTDARLFRRLVRDYQFRGAGALKTLRQWPEVRAGEDKNIFPFQEDADTVFNSALLYELAVLKKYAEPLLREIPKDVVEYQKAQDLLSFCPCFLNIDDEDDIPNNSILREFIGKSCFFRSDGTLKE